MIDKLQTKIGSVILTLGLSGCSAFVTPSIEEEEKENLSCFDYQKNQTRITGYRNQDGYGEMMPPRCCMIPEGVKSIAQSAFENQYLLSLTLPSTLKTLEKNAFKNNSLISAIIPDSVISIGNGVFHGNSLQSITLSNNMVSIIFWKLCIFWKYFNINNYSKQYHFHWRSRISWKLINFANPSR